MALSSSGHKGVSRIDNPKRHTHGWYVRVQFNGQTHSKFFSDATAGGEDRGLAKAVRHRNKLEREVGKPRTDRTVFISNPRNRSGVLGVQRVDKGPGGAYQVTWSPRPNLVQRTSVSIQKYGEEEAFRRACEIRRQKERKVFGGVIMDVSRAETQRAEEAAQHSLLRPQRGSASSGATSSPGAVANGSSTAGSPTRATRAASADGAAKTAVGPKRSGAERRNAKSSARAESSTQEPSGAKPRNAKPRSTESSARAESSTQKSSAQKSSAQKPRGSEPLVTKPSRAKPGSAKLRNAKLSTSSTQQPQPPARRKSPGRRKAAPQT